MKIILAVPGHLKTVPMNDYVFLTLQAMGHEVRRFDFGAPGMTGRLIKKISRRLFLQVLAGRLERLLDRFQPDVFLTIFGMDLQAAMLERLRERRVPTICWWLNDPFQLPRSLAQAGYYDYYFTNAKGCLGHYREAGIRQVFYLPVGCFPEVHHRLTGVEKAYGVGFAGDWSPKRAEILSRLAQEFPVAIWGPWKKHLPPDSILHHCLVRDGFFTPQEMVHMFNGAQVVLNIHSWFGKWDYGLNPRVFEACGSGAFQLCDFKEEIPEHYLPDQEIVLYRSVAELRERLRHFLDHPGEAAKIGEQGYLRSHRQHTYALRLAEMFRQCGLRD